MFWADGCCTWVKQTNSSRLRALRTCLSQFFIWLYDQLWIYMCVRVCVCACVCVCVCEKVSFSHTPENWSTPSGSRAAAALGAAAASCSAPPGKESDTCWLPWCCRGEATGSEVEEAESCSNSETVVLFLNVYRAAIIVKELVMTYRSTGLIHTLKGNSISL